MGHSVHRVTAFEIVEPFVLNVRFDDRTQQQIDFLPVLHGELYGALRDAAAFERVAIDPDAHTLVWPNGADFDPATLHDWSAVGPRMIELARGWADAERSGRTGRGDARIRCRIIGVDCATKDINTGLALAASDNDGLRLLEARIGNFEGGSARSILEEWLADSEDAALIAIDAPLGWPRSLRRRTFAAGNGSPAHALSSVSGRLRRSAGRDGFSVIGEQRAKFGPRGPHGPPETAMRVAFPPLGTAFPASYAAINTCRRLTFNARHTKSHSQRTFASPRRLKRRKPSACLIQP